MLTTWKASVVISGLALLAACDQLTGPKTINLSPSASLSTDKVRHDQQEVTGHARYLVTPEQNAFEAYSLSAIRHANGAVTGEVQIRSAINGGFKIHGEVACFTIVGNSARLAAKVTKSTNPNVAPGAYLFWSLVDNGEGANHSPDLSTQFFLADQVLASYHCSTGVTPLTFFPVMRGNLQVHD